MKYLKQYLEQEVDQKEILKKTRKAKLKRIFEEDPSQEGSSSILPKNSIWKKIFKK